MHFIVLSTAIFAAYAHARAAKQYNNNPTDVVAVADFPQGGKKLLGTMKFFSTNGTVKVHWDVTKLPKRRTPFYYEIHEKPVGRLGKCSSAGKRFNPNRGPAKCESVENDSLCAVGDLSGKHGWIATTCFETSYYDPYLSLNERDPTYVVGKSIVVHYPDSLRMACADIVLSEETPELADKESKRNVQHNKDLVEAGMEDWEPTPEEKKMMDEAHKEWLKYNSEITEAVEASEAVDIAENDEEFESLFQEWDLDEGVDSQGYEKVVPEEKILTESPWDEPQNGGLMNGAGIGGALGGLFALWGMLL